jgi:hypothetical protein
MQGKVLPTREKTSKYTSYEPSLLRTLGFLAILLRTSTCLAYSDSKVENRILR